MPDMEALEVAQSSLPDESVSETSENQETVTEVESQAESAESGEGSAQDADEAQGKDEAETKTESESASARRRRIRREKREQQDREMAALRERNAKLEKQLEGLQRPDRSHYHSEAEYAASLAAYNVQANSANAEATEIREAAEASTSSEQESFNEALTDFNSEGTAKYKDFTDLVTKPADQGGPQITPIMAEALFEADSGVDIAYHLATHTAEAEKIAKMSPVGQAMEIVRLGDRLKAEAKPKTSSAPKPIKPVKSGGASSQKAVSEMSMSEYYNYRTKQLAGES